MDTIQRIKKIMSRIFRLPEDCISEQSSMDNVPGWDSLAHITMIIAVEEEFGVSLDAKEASQACSVAKIISIIERRS
jgi:acyl carrier protein